MESPAMGLDGGHNKKAGLRLLIKSFFYIFALVFHRILDFKRSWMSIRLFFFRYTY
jgi:hypothetical protein